MAKQQRGRPDRGWRRRFYRCAATISERRDDMAEESFRAWIGETNQVKLQSARDWATMRTWRRGRDGSGFGLWPVPCRTATEHRCGDMDAGAPSTFIMQRGGASTRARDRELSCHAVVRGRDEPGKKERWALWAFGAHAKQRSGWPGRLAREW